MHQNIQLLINYEKNDQPHYLSKKCKLKYHFAQQAFLMKKKITSIGKDIGNKSALSIIGEVQPPRRVIWQHL